MSIEPVRNASPHQLTDAGARQRYSLECSVCSTGKGELWGKDGFSFEDVIDTVNPLQQLPGVSTIYRGLTGDAISTGARLIGGAIFGGPMGFLMAAVSSAFEGITGSLIGGDESTQAAQAANKYQQANKLGS